MNNREAHFYLEELQRMMTQHRGIFSEEFVIANGMAIQALECNITSDVVPLIRCKDCKYDHTCTHMMVRKSSGGGNIYCPVTYCSEGKRKEE